MKKLRIIYAMIVSAALFLALSLTAAADFGPKPYIKITFTHTNGERFYSTILARGDFQPPGWEKFSEADYDSEQFTKLSPDDRDAVRTFAEYPAPEGYNFFGPNRMWNSGKSTIEWGYMPPDDFVVLVYFPDSGKVLESGVCSTYAFNSSFVADLSGQELSVDQSSNSGLSINPSYNFGTALLEFAARLAITIAVELAVALIFGYLEKRTLIFFAVVNSATQVLLNLILSLVNFRYGLTLFLFAYFIGELLVVILEACFYGMEIEKYSKHHKSGARAVFYAICANIASFAAGVIFTVNFTQVM